MLVLRTKQICRTAIVLCSLAVFACKTTAPTHVVTGKDYRIYSVVQNKEVTLADIAATMATNDVLIFGEEHNDAVGHYLEKAMLEELFKTNGVAVTLSMEMFERDVQLVLDEYLQGTIRDKELVKDGRAWNNYKDYRPMVDFAKEHKLDVLAANAPGRYASIAGRKGPAALATLTDHAKRFIAPLPYDTATGDYYKKLTDVGEHAGPAPAKKDTTHKDSTKLKSATAVADTATKPAGPPPFNIIYGQSLWDATMASTIATYRKSHPDKKIFQVNGRFHSDERFGIVQQLQKYDAACRVVVISSGSDSAFITAKYDSVKKNGDYIIVTDPNLPRSYGE